MKKVFLSMALVAFIGATTVSAASLGTDKEKTTKSDKKKGSNKKACCKKGEGSHACCKKGEEKKAQ